jgi:hypothetical protein
MTMRTPIARGAEQEEEADSASVAESLYEEEDDDDQDVAPNQDLDLFSRPIVVGYAFGPKKMSTMGVVMAEASKTKLSRTSAFRGIESLQELHLPEACPPYAGSPNSHIRHDIPSSGELGGLTRAAILSNDNVNSQVDQGRTEITQRMTREISESSNYSQGSINGVSSYGAAAAYGQHSCAKSSFYQNQQEDTVVFTMDHGLFSSNSTPASDKSLLNIVRYFRSSCSSVADSTSTGTCTASSTSQRTASTALMTTMSSSGSSKGRQRQSTVRVSFVPLDMEVPLEEQHSGKIDV